jgi:hypothetical protein
MPPLFPLFLGKRIPLKATCVWRPHVNCSGENKGANTKTLYQSSIIILREKLSRVGLDSIRQTGKT